MPKLPTHTTMAPEISNLCSMSQLDGSVKFLIFRMVPVISIPFYLLAWLLVTRNKSKVVQAVRKHYLRQMLINYISVVLLCIIVCPVLVPPIPGYIMTGLLAPLQLDAVYPLVMMTHMVLLVACAIIKLFKHQLVTLSDFRYTKKYELPVRVIKRMYNLCYVMMIFVALAILPTLSIDLNMQEFRQGAFEYFQNPLVLCEEMFIADPRHWKIYVPYFMSISFGGLCFVTGVSSVVTCLKMIYDSRKMVSRDTLIMQRNFTFILVYQALVCVIFIIIPLGTVSTLFYVDILISENGLYYLLLISSQGTVNNMMHIVPGLWRKLRKKANVIQSRQSWKGSSMWSTSVVSNVASTQC
ncbi:unnamed protein product [Caenorhabditis brenneri]